MKTWLSIAVMVSLLSGCALQGAKQASVRTSIARQQTIDIASNDIVRIVTPFAAPRVVTTSEVDIQRSQNVLYVLPDQNEPISMFVTDGESEADALSLVLKPKEGGKREVYFEAPVAATVAKAPQLRGIRPAASVQMFFEQEAPAERVREKEVDPYGKPCRLCRDPDDHGENDHAGGGHHDGSSHN